MLKDHRTIHSIQMLRAIAAGMVVIFHATAYLSSRNHIEEVPRWIEAGRSGVDLFFVISGFIMVWISDQKFGVEGASKDFLIRRVIRVVPIYWFYTLLMAGLATALPHLVSQGKTVGIEHLFASLFFVPWENSVGYVKPVLSPGWTLNFEMYFYLVFAVLLFIRKQYFLPLLAIYMLSGVMAGFILDDMPVLLHVATSPLLVEFLFGCTVAMLLKRGIPMTNGLAAFLLLTGTAALITTGFLPTPDVPRYLKYGIPSAMIVVGIVHLEHAGRFHTPEILSLLGNSSYSLYLSHLFTISAFGKIWFTLVGGMHIAFVVAASLVSIIVGHYAWKLLENPVTLFLNNRYRSYRSRRLATA